MHPLLSDLSLIYFISSSMELISTQLNSSLFTSCSRKAKKRCNAVQRTNNSKNTIKRTQYENIQQLIVQCSQIPRLRRSLQSSIYINIQCS